MKVIISPEQDERIKNLIIKIGNRFVYDPIVKTEIRSVRRLKGSSEYNVSPIFYLNNLSNYRIHDEYLFAKYIKSVMGVEINTIKPRKVLMKNDNKIDPLPM
jgi:hypothetical protein